MLAGVLTQEGILTSQEAAAYLGVSRFKGARLIREGDLPTPLDGRTPLVRREDLDALKTRHTPAADSPYTRAARPGREMGPA